jgi:hypothetical protein
MAGGLDHERFVDDDGGVLEAGVEIAVGPLLGGLAHRQRTGRRRREILIGPLQRAERWPRRRAGGALRGGGAGHPDVALTAAVGAGGAEALDRIDDKRQRLEVEFDALDRRGGSVLVDGGDGEESARRDRAARWSARVRRREGREGRRRSGSP